MSKFLFTMWPANDLGLPSRLVPIARLLADRGHEVAMFNPAPAPANLIADAGLTNLPFPAAPIAPPVFDLNGIHLAWDAEELLAPCYCDEEFVNAMTAIYVKLIQDHAPDVVVDSFELFACLAARITKVPLVTVLQASFHPASDGFYWWKPDRPQNRPSAAPVLNKTATSYGLAPRPRCVDWFVGDCSLIVGTPETDPLPANANVEYAGPLVWQRSSAALPDWINSLDAAKPLIWVYSGNPRYAAAATPLIGVQSPSTPADSIVVIRTAIAALADMPVHVVLTTGYQQLPPEVGTLPANFHHAAYLPGMAMAQRSALMVHHGGHGSSMTGLRADTPAVIIPTISEREGNARRGAYRRGGWRKACGRGGIPGEGRTRLAGSRVSCFGATRGGVGAEVRRGAYGRGANREIRGRIESPAGGTFVGPGFRVCVRAYEWQFKTAKTKPQRLKPLLVLRSLRHG